MLRDAEQWRQADAARRKIVELKNQCDKFMSQVEDQMRLHKINDQLRKLIDRDLEALRRSIAD